MTMPPKFCTACGCPARCRHAVLQPVRAAGCHARALPHTCPAATAAPQPAGPLPAAPEGGERILGIVPFIEQGLLSVIHYTLIVTDRRLIFCTWDPGTDEAMSDADDDGDAGVL